MATEEPASATHLRHVVRTKPTPRTHDEGGWFTCNVFALRRHCDDRTLKPRTTKWTNACRGRPCAERAGIAEQEHEQDQARHVRRASPPPGSLCLDLLSFCEIVSS